MALLFLNAGCSAILTNKDNKWVKINACDTYWPVYADVGLSAGLVASRLALRNKEHDKVETHKVLATMLAVGFATSAFMGYGHCLKEKRNE